MTTFDQNYFSHRLFSLVKGHKIVDNKKCTTGHPDQIKSALGLVFSIMMINCLSAKELKKWAKCYRFFHEHFNGLVTLKRVAPSDVIQDEFHASRLLTEKKKGKGSNVRPETYFK